ncbi:Rhodanese-like domain-containing protein, partial [Vararia minispora EC-137]
EQRKAILKERDELSKDWVAPVISYEQVKQRSEQPSPDAFLIDVREPDEVIQGSIPSSVNLPLSQMTAAMQVPAEEWQTKFGWPKPRPHQEIVFYCRSGKRSASASDIARRNGFKNILNYEGSWLDWVAKEGKK